MEAAISEPSHSGEGNIVEDMFPRSCCCVVGLDTWETRPHRGVILPKWPNILCCSSEGVCSSLFLGLRRGGHSKERMIEELGLGQHATTQGTTHNGHAGHNP